jgi:septum formation protein
MEIILASSSKPRIQLLKQILTNFTPISPNIDESQLPHESSTQLVERLANNKAQAIFNSHPNAIIIGADQVACHDGNTQGKCHTFDSAYQWLQKASGQQVDFFSAMAVISPNNPIYLSTTKTTVIYRDLSNRQITNYLNHEKPYSAAGAMHIEGLGICLANKVISEDPSAMLGLSLTKLSKILDEMGADPLTQQSQQR